MIHIFKFLVLQGILFATILLLSYSKSEAQTFQQIRLASYFPAKQHKIYDFNFGISPEVGIRWQKEKFSTGISLGYIWWNVGNEQVQRLNSLKIGVDESYFITIRDRRWGITAGLSYMLNETKFQESELIAEYDSKFLWTNIAWKLGTSFVSRKEISVDLSYFAMLPSAEIQMYRFGFVEVGLGYRFKLKKKGETE